MGGLAAACGLVLAYRTAWNPLPACGVLGLALLAWHLPYRAIAEGVLMQWTENPLEDLRGSFHMGEGDPFQVYWQKAAWVRINNSVQTQYWSKAGRDWGPGVEKRRMYWWPVDGSEKRPDFQRDWNPAAMPLWWRLVYLPELVGLNAGVRR